jgi:hypothetical protein
VLKLYTHRSKAFWKSVYHVPRPRSSSRRTGNGGDWDTARNVPIISLLERTIAVSAKDVF